MEFTNAQVEHRLTCGWCNAEQNPLDVGIRIAKSKRVKISGPCWQCEMPLTFKVSKLGFYSAYQSDRKRLFRSIERGVSRISKIKKFTLAGYESGEFDVVTRDQKPVRISGINLDASEGHQLIGWLEFRKGSTEVYAWNLDGKLYGWIGTDYPHDLFLKLKNN
jgi:hypothetical protein